MRKIGLEPYKLPLVCLVCVCVFLFPCFLCPPLCLFSFLPHTPHTPVSLKLFSCLPPRPCLPLLLLRCAFNSRCSLERSLVVVVAAAAAAAAFVVVVAAAVIALLLFPCSPCSPVPPLLLFPLVFPLCPLPYQTFLLWLIKSHNNGQATRNPYRSSAACPPPQPALARSQVQEGASWHSTQGQPIWWCFTRQGHRCREDVRLENSARHKRACV